MRHSDSLKKCYLWQWYRFTQSSMRLSLEQATKWIDDDIRQKLLREYLYLLYAYYKRRRRCNIACTRSYLRSKYRKGLLKLHKLIVHQRKREKNNKFVISHRIFQSIFYYLKKWRRFLGFKFRYNIYSTQYGNLIALYRSSRGFNHLRKSIKSREKNRQVYKFSSSTAVLRRCLKQWISRGKGSQELRSYTNQCINRKYLKRWLQFLSTRHMLRESDDAVDNSLNNVYLRVKALVFIKIRRYMNNRMKTRSVMRSFDTGLCHSAVNALRRNIYRKRRLLKLIRTGDAAAKKKSALLQRYTYYIFKRFTCEGIVNKLRVSQHRLQRAKQRGLVALYKLQCHRHAHCVLLSITKLRNATHQRNALKFIYWRMKNRAYRSARLRSFLEQIESRRQLLVINHLRYLVRKSCRAKLLVKGYTQLKHYISWHKFNFQKIQNAKRYRRRKLLANTLWKLYRSWKRSIIASHHLLYIEEHVYNFRLKYSIKKWRKCVQYTQRVSDCRHRVTIMVSHNACCRAIKVWKNLLGLQVRRRSGIALISACTRAYTSCTYRNSLANWVDYVRICRLNQQYACLNRLLMPIWKGCYERHYHYQYSDIHSAVKLYKTKYVASMKFCRGMLQRRVIRLLKIYLQDRRSKVNILLSLYKQYILKWRLCHNKYLLVTNHQRGGQVYYKNRLSANALWQLFQHCKRSQRHRHYSSLSDTIRQIQARRHLKRSMKKLFVAIFHNKRKLKCQQAGTSHFQKSLAMKGFGVLFTKLELRKCKQLIEYDVTRRHHEPNLCRRYLLIWSSRVKPSPVIAEAISQDQCKYVSSPQIAKPRPNYRKSQYSPSYFRERRLMRTAFFQLNQWSKDRVSRRFDLKSVRHTNILGRSATASFPSRQVVSNQLYFTDSDDDSDHKVGQTYLLGPLMLARYIMRWKLYSYRHKGARSLDESVDLNFQHRFKAISFYLLLRYTRRCSARRSHDTGICTLGWKASRCRHVLEALKSKLSLTNKYFLCVRKLNKKKVRNRYYKLFRLVSSWLQQHKSLRRSTRFESRNVLGKAIATWVSYASRRHRFRPNRYKSLVANFVRISSNYRRGVNAEHPIGIYYRNRLVSKWFAIFARVVTGRIKYRKAIYRKRMLVKSNIDASRLALCYRSWRFQHQLRINKYIVFKLVDSATRYCGRLRLAVAWRTWKVLTYHKRIYMLLQPYIMGVYQRNYHRELSKVSKYLKWIMSMHNTIVQVRQRHRAAMQRQIFRILIRYKHIQRIHATLSVDLYNQQLALLRWRRCYQCSSKRRRLLWFVRYYRTKKSTSIAWNNIAVMLKCTRKERTVQSVLRRKKLLAAFGSMRVQCKRLISHVDYTNKRCAMTKVQHSCAHLERKRMVDALIMYKLNVGYRVLQRGLLTTGWDTHLVLSLPRQLRRVLFALYMNGGKRRVNHSDLNLARYHLERARQREAIGLMAANVRRRRLLRAGRKHHLSGFLRLFSTFFSRRTVARNRCDICCFYHNNSKKSQCLHRWRDYCCGKMYGKRRVTRHYVRRICKSYLRRIQVILRGKSVIKRSHRLLCRYQSATRLLECDPKHVFLHRWRRRSDRSRRLASITAVVSNPLVRLVFSRFCHYASAKINGVNNAMKAIGHLRSKRLFLGWRTLFARCYYSHHRRHHTVLYLYTKTDAIIRRLRMLPHQVLASFIRLVLKRKRTLLRHRHVTNYQSFVLIRAGYNSLFRYKFYRNKYLRQAEISEYYYTRRLLAMYYDRCRRLCRVNYLRNRKVIRYIVRKYFNWYRRGVQNIKSLCVRLAVIRKRSEQSVKLRVFLEWFYLYRKRNYYSYLCEIIHRKQVLNTFNKWISRYESSKLLKLGSIIQRTCELRIQREHFQSMKFIYLYKKAVVSRMHSRKLAIALHRIVVVVTTRFIRQKDVRVARKHFVAYMRRKYLRLWLMKHQQRKLRLISMQQNTRKVLIKCRRKYFYYLMTVLSRKLALRRRSFKLLRDNAEGRRSKCYQVLLRRAYRKSMKRASHYLLQWRRYNNFNRSRREAFVQRVNRVNLCAYFIQLRKHTNYQVFKKMAVLYLRLSRQRSYLRVWVVAYQRTVRARVRIMDIFYTTRRNSLKFTFIHWQISAKHFVRLQQLYSGHSLTHSLTQSLTHSLTHSGGLISIAFRQWLTLHNAISHHKKVTLRIHFRRLKCVKLILYQKQQNLLRRRKFYQVFSTLLHRFSSKELARLFHQWKQSTRVSGDYASSRYSTPWK